MRIIGGSHKGRIIEKNKNLKLRPTTEIAKEALFNILDNRYFFENKNVLDLFSGTGSISFEFASRGVKSILAIDKNIKSINFINQISLKLDLQVNTINLDALDYIKKCKKKFDFIFADPPYNYNYYYELKETILNSQIIKKDGLLIIEHDKNTTFNEPNIELRKYGTVHFSIFSF
tara:strand:+ start:846 stop:1370 length:525 start_codon:yes stop_codon:yes gene_type:complete